MVLAPSTALASRINALADKDGLDLIVKCPAKLPVPCPAVARALAAVLARAPVTLATMAAGVSIHSALKRLSKLSRAVSSTALQTVHFH
jgi:hypothetical protein